MRRIMMIGIIAILLGAVLLCYSIFQFGAVILNDKYLTARAIMILGFVMMAGGGLIALSPFNRK